MSKSGAIKTGIFLIVLLVNLFVRIWKTDVSPVNINWDEASLGYNAYSLMLTGKDEYGVSWPLNLRSFNDYKPALYAYLTIPFIKIWGLNPWSLRMASGFYGTLSLIPLYLILKMFVKNEFKALIYWSFISLGPMRIHFSRTALESNVSAGFFGFGAYFWMIFLKNKFSLLNKYAGAAILFFGLSVYTYHSARMAVPGLIFLSIIDPLDHILRKKFNFNPRKLKMLFYLIVIAAVMLPLFIQSGSSNTLTRFNQENIWAKFYPFTPRGLFEDDLVSTIRVNPIYYFLGILWGHISAYFSPANLVLSQYHWIRQSVMYVPGYNMLGVIEGIFLIIGWLFLAKNLGDWKHRYLMYWFLAAIAPSVLTWNWFHILRSANMLPVVEILAVVGISYTVDLLIKKKMVGLILGILVLWSWQTIFIINNELVYSNFENYGEYQPDGFKEGVPEVMNLIDNYDKVVVESPQAQTYIFFLFYSKYDPGLFQEKNLIQMTKNEDGSIGYNFGKFEFRKIDWAKDQKLKKTIIWMPANISTHDVEAVEGAKVVKRISSPIKDIDSAMIVTLD